jgi:hypothetical protein
MRVISTVTAFLILIGADALQAQTPENLAGSRIRVTACGPGSAPCARIAGTLVSWEPGSVVLRDSAGIERRVETGARAELQRSRGRGSRWLLGLGIGAAVGGSLGVASALQCGSDEAAACYAGAPLGLGLGMGLGALIGALSRYERWETVRVSSLALSARPTGPGILVSARLTF